MKIKKRNRGFRLPIDLLEKMDASDFDATKVVTEAFQEILNCKICPTCGTKLKAKKASK